MRRLFAFVLLLVAWSSEGAPASSVPRPVSELLCLIESHAAVYVAGQPNLIDSLAEELALKGPDVVSQLLDYLEREEPPAECKAQIVGEPDHGLARAYVCVALAAMGPVVVPGLTLEFERRPQARVWLADVFARLGGEATAAAPALVRGLEEAQATKSGILYALSRVGLAKSAPKHESLRATREVVRALRDTDAVFDAATALERFLNDGVLDGPMRLDACRGLDVAEKSARLTAGTGAAERAAKVRALICAPQNNQMQRTGPGQSDPRR